jgi:hypothetical protein
MPVRFPDDVVVPDSVFWRRGQISSTARHLKRASKRLLNQPLLKLIASGQIPSGDLIEIDYESESRALTFSRQDEGNGADRHGLLVG